MVEGNPLHNDHFIKSSLYKKGKYMAHHKSALKRVRQTFKRTARNRSLRSDLRTVIKKFRTILASGNIDQAHASFTSVQRNIDKAVTKGVLHKRTGARYKSRLALSMGKTLKS